LIARRLLAFFRLNKDKPETTTMKTSKYAPKTPAEGLAQSKADKLKQDKDRVTRLLGRVRWKAEMLMVSYMRTMEIVQAAAQENEYHQSQHAMGSGASSVRVHQLHH
jgi:hypothetical protein